MHKVSQCCLGLHKLGVFHVICISNTNVTCVTKTSSVKCMKSFAELNTVVSSNQEGFRQETASNHSALFDLVLRPLCLRKELNGQRWSPRRA